MTIARDLSKILDANGDLNIDANTLFVDSSTNSVGIGISSPESKLAIKGSSGSSDLFSISDITVPTSGSEYGVAMIKTNSSDYALNITGYNTNSKGVRIYTNGGSSADTLLLATTASTGTAMLIDGVGNVGIGNTPETWYSTFSALQIGANKSAIYGRSENNQLSLASNSYVNASGNNTYINSSEASLYEQNSGVHKFFTAPSGTAGNSLTFTERVRISADGLHLGGTGSANALDTYEEGTWTPSLTSSGGSVSASYGTRLGKYTRVGNIVHCSFSMRVASHSGGSGEYRVSGLPFTSNTAGNDHIGVSTAGLEGHPISSAIQNIQIIDNLKTYVRLLIAQNNTSWTTYTPQSNNSVYMSFTYPINQ